MIRTPTLPMGLTVYQVLGTQSPRLHISSFMAVMQSSPSSLTSGTRPVSVLPELPGGNTRDGNVHGIHVSLGPKVCMIVYETWMLRR